ncbi:GntR family transcriptional regulator [Streptomyces sp. NPDC087300]|uniref:GntR family transcriptional regulator n=1 Tax=Streptomyces sp. NPDC087300 TaxID=3365780 RepID=UPI0038149CCB
MAPTVDRTPVYLQVVNHLRDQILKGEISDGEKIPSVRQLAETWQISQATALKAVAALRADGLVESVVGHGTLVRSKTTLHRSSHDRLSRMLSTGRIYTPGEYAVISVAEVVSAPDHVADTYGIEPGAPVIKRVRVTHNDEGTPVSASTSWFSADLADAAPELLSTERIPGGTASVILRATDRTAHSADDRMTVDSATADQAEALGLPEGSPIFMGQNTWRDSDGDVIEFGEYFFGPGRWMHYRYELNS